MAFSAIIKPSDYFNTKLYTGTGSSNAQTGVGFQPDWIWLKNRSLSSNHHLVDAVRGITKELRSNLTNTEATDDQLITAFGSDGFTVGTSGSGNTNGDNYASWNWKANGAGSTNTVGSIDSTVSVNTASGFSIVKVLKSSSAVATIGHGLGVTPKMFIVKSIDAGNNWQVYHEATGATKALYLNGSGVPVTTSGFFNNTAPTSTVLTLGSDGAFTGNTMIIYCFADVQGFSKMGSYTGNGNADGSFIYTGFKPAFVIIKESNGTNSWQMWDNKTSPYNLANAYLQPNTTSAEISGNNQIDILSNGIKLRSSNTANNGSGQSFIFMAFAEEPFVANSGESIPTTAR